MTSRLPGAPNARANFLPDPEHERIGPFLLMPRLVRQSGGGQWECLWFRIEGEMTIPLGACVIGCHSSEYALERGRERVRAKLHEAAELIALARAADAELGATEWTDVEAAAPWTLALDKSGKQG